LKTVENNTGIVEVQMQLHNSGYNAGSHIGFRRFYCVS